MDLSWSTDALASALAITARQEWQMPENLSRQGLLFLGLSGLATGASWLCYYRALQLGPASKVAPLDKLSVVFVLIFAVLFLKETLTWKTWLGGLMIGSGALLLTF